MSGMWYSSPRATDKRQTSVRKLILTLVVLSFSWAVGPSPNLLAAGGSLGLSSSISVAEGGNARVKHVFSLKGVTNLPEHAELSVVGESIKGLSAKGEDNAKLPIALSEDGQRLSVAIPANRRAKSGTWSFSVEYTSASLNDLGGVKALQVPALAANLPITKQNLRIAADLDLGFASVRGPAPAKTGVGIGQQLLDFADKDSQLEESVLVLFGRSTSASVTIQTTLKNNGWWWRDVTLTLPPDTNQQRASLASLDPQPSNVRLDRDGNILAVYRIGPLGQKDVTAQVNLEVSGLSYDLDKALPPDQTDPLLLERYTGQTNAWRPQGFATDIDTTTNAAEVTEAVFTAVVERIRAEEDNIDQLLQVRDRTPPLKYADWLVGELRSRGLPARVVLGLVFSDGERLLEEPKQSAWAEVFVAGVGWMTLDPWLGAHSGQFGGSDPLHIALGLWGLEDDRPPVPVDAARVVFNDEELPAAAEPQRQIRAVKHVVLPFFSVLQISANHGEVTIVDDVAVQAGGQRYLVGSVAPGGWASQRLPVLGARAFSAETVQAGQMSGDQFNSWTETNTRISYWPLITLILLLMALWIIKRWRGRLSPERRRWRPSKESLTLHEEATGGDVEAENLVNAAPPVADINITDQRETDDSKPEHQRLVQ